MFLIYILIAYLFLLRHIINYILVFIEEHSVLTGVITSVCAGAMWIHKFLRQKRAEAFFGFYTKLSLYLSELQTLLDDKNLLEVNDSKKGNIYALLYVEDVLDNVCPSFHRIDASELEVYKKIAKNIIELLTTSEQNVYPKNADKKTWYKSQQEIFSFCYFICEEDRHKKINNIKKHKPQHIAKCEALIKAINYIQESIYNAKY